jgi:tetratricopeptide (TPR) repeat protein
MAGLGRTAEALTLSEQALSSWDYPYEVHLDHARQLGFHARLLHARRMSVEAANRQREATLLWRSLCADDAKRLVHLARSLSAQADYLRAARGRVEAAAAALEAAELWEKLDEAAPDDRYQIDLLDAWIAQAISPEISAPARLESVRRAADSLERLWPRDVTLLARATNAQRVLATVLSDAGEHDEALSRIRTARKMFGWLAEQDPTRHRRLHARVLFAYVRLCMLKEVDLTEAIKAAGDAEKIFESLGETAEATAAARLGDQCSALRKFGQVPLPTVVKWTSKGCLACGGTGQQRRLPLGGSAVRTIRCTHCQGKGFIRSRE